MQKRVQVNPIYRPLFKNQSRHLVLYGGAGSGKSVFATQKICRRFLEEYPHTFLVLRNTATSIKDSVFKEIKEILSNWGQLGRIRINYSEHRFTLDNGNQIICKGLDDEQKIKSIAGITGMWIEETTELKEEVFDQLNIRIRGTHKNYIQYISSFNPIDEDHWIKTRLIDSGRDDTTFIHTTYHDNLFLSKEDKDVLEGYKETNRLYYDVYCIGQWGQVDKSGKFLFAFDQDKHVKEVDQDDSLSIKLSFDFNLEPFVTTIYQTPDEHTVNFIDHVRLNDSDIEQVCDHIKAKYPNNFFIVTGDASGKNRTGTTRGKTSYWKMIKHNLQLTNSQIRLRSMNLGLIESRVLCNAALSSKVININIAPHLKELINDCKFAKVDDHGILTKDRKKQKNDYLDTFRYALDAEFPKLIYKPKQYE